MGIIRALILTFSMFFALMHQSKGQANFPSERIELTIDRNVYFEGESIRFIAKVQMFENEWKPTISKSLYLDIISTTGAVVAQTKCLIKNGEVHGSFALINAIPTGDYWLNCYTRYNSNAPKMYNGAIQIRIINPELKSVTRPSHLINQSKIIDSSLISAQLQGNTITLKKRTPFKNNITVSLIAQGLSKPGGNSTVSTSIEDLTYTLPNQDLPDIYGLALTGHVNLKNQNPLNQLVSATVTGAYHQVHFARTDSTGVFRFNLPQTTGNQEVIFCLLNAQSTFDLKISSEFGKELRPLKWQKDTIDWNNSSITSAYINHQINRDVAANYVIPKAQMLPAPPVPLSTPTETIYLKDYVALSSMQQIINEIVPYCTIRKKDNAQVLHVFNPNNRSSFYGSMLMIDHLPVNSIDNILKLDLKRVESIDIFAEEFVMGNEIIKGCLNINTPSKSALSVDLPKHCRVVEFPTISISKGILDQHTPKTAIGNTLYFGSLPINKNELSIELPKGVNTNNYSILISSFDEKNRIIYQVIELKDLTN